MEVDLEELISSLHSLKQLYGLLIKDGNGLPNSTSNMLDDKSRLLLKDLLDRAADNVFKIHSEVLGSQFGSSFTECSERAQQLGDLKTQVPATKMLDVRQICGNDQNGVEFTELDDDCKFREPRTRRLPSMQPTLRVAASGYANRHKYCRVCQRRILRHPLESASCDTRNGAKSVAWSQEQDYKSDSFLCDEEMETLKSPIRSSGSDMDDERRKTSQFDYISSGLGSTDSSSNRPADADGVESGPLPELTEEIAQRNERLSFLSKQASDAINQIEVQILDLQRGTENLGSNGTCTAVPISLGVSDSQLGIDNRQCKGTSLLNQVPLRRLPMEMELPKLTAGSPLKLLPLRKVKINMADLRQNQSVLEENIMKSGAFPIPSKNQNMRALDARHKVNKFLGSQSKKGFLGERKKRQPSLQHKADQYPARRILYRRHESDTSLSSNSSKWESQQTSTSYCRSSENDLYSLTGDSQVYYEGLSNSDNEVYSWRSSDTTSESTSYGGDERKGNSLPSSANSSQVSYSADSETEGCSSYNQPRFQHRWQPRDFSGASTSTKNIRPTRIYGASTRKNAAKMIGGWRKLKDKLSIMFHHHHHHHHHLYHQQHGDDDGDGSNWKNKMYWKHSSKHSSVNSRLLRPDDYKKQAPEKIHKAVIHGRVTKRQKKPVNALIGGLFKHVRHSKRSKLSAKHIKPLRDDHYDGNKASAKLNWWKMLQRHRKANKLGNGGRKR